MIAFRVSIGNELIAKAGLNEQGVLSCIVSAGREDDESDLDFLRIFVGALKTGEDCEHLRWVMKSLRCGDSILVEVVEADAVDEPAHRQIA